MDCLQPGLAGIGRDAYPVLSPRLCEAAPPRCKMIKIILRRIPYKVGGEMERQTGEYIEIGLFGRIIEECEVSLGCPDAGG